MLFNQNLLYLKAHQHPCAWLRLALKLALALALSSNTLAQASSTAHDSIKQAIQSGQLDQALKLVLQERQNAPNDVQLRLMEGVIQAQQGQVDKAIESFKRLTEANPDVSEAYNNLGVLYASKGKLEEARAQFEKALLTHPSYAAAHRNLADVQSQLAKQTYAKALQIESKAKNSTPQLTLLGSIDPSKRAPPPLNPPAPLVAQSVPSPKPALVPPNSKESPAPSLSAAAKPGVVALSPAAAPKPAPAAEVQSALASSKSEPAKDDAQQKQNKTDQNELRQDINAWAKAWSQKDMPRYLASYASEFTPPDKMSRTSWESDRRARIVSKKTISVDINNLKLELVQGNKAIARFQQVYESDNFKGNIHKTLEMVKQGDRWLISRETVN